MVVNWKRVEENTHVLCCSKTDLHFEGIDLSIPEGTNFRGIFIGYDEEDSIFRTRIQAPDYDCTFALRPSEITVTLLNTKRCFRCDWDVPLSTFERHALIVDKSPILAEVCSDCYRRVKNKVAEHHSHARRHGGMYTLKVSEWLEILKASEGHCHYCNKLVGYENLIVEHQTPLSWKGANSKENVVPACISCNSSKGDRDVETWLRHMEVKMLLDQLQERLGLSKFEVTNLAIKTLAQSIGLIEKDGGKGNESKTQS